MRAVKRSVVAALVLGAAVFALPANAGPVNSVPGNGPWEANVTHYTDGQDGEPSIAVNPNDPQNIIITYLETGGAGGAVVYRQAIPRLNDEVLQPIQSCRYVVTHDGGQTWRMKFIPTTDLIMPNCSDTYVLFDKFGKAYLMAGNFNPAFPLWDEIRVITSVDGGETWSAPATALRNTLNPGSAPVQDLSQGRVRQYIDRYWLALDDSTGDLYITAVQTWVQTSPAPSAGALGPIVVSHDGGRTWSEPSVAAPVGSPFPAAAFGRVATTYADAACSCMDFAISTDGGQSFTVKQTPFAGGKGHAVADQTTPGRFAVLATNGPDLTVYVTTDDGTTWSSGALVTQSMANDVRGKPWISYSRTGVLGVGWRNQYADGTYDFFAAASLDGGLNFGVPRKITTSPSEAQSMVWVGGDDTSDVQFGPDDTLYAAWGHWTNGDLDIHWGGFPTRMDDGR